MRGWVCRACQWKNTGKVCEKCRTRKTTTRSSISKRCDSLAAWLCKAVAGFRCARCGKPGIGPERTGGLEWSHRVKRRFRSVRWDPDNADCLCAECHRFFETRPLAYFEWIRGRGGDPADLERRGNEPWDRDYGAVLVRLTTAVQEMKERL